MKFQHLMATALLFVALDSRAALIHQFDLNGSLQDARSGKTLSTLGGKLEAGQYVFGANQGLYLELDKHLDSYTIDMAFRLDEIGGFRRLVDFKKQVSDSGLYTEGSAFRLYDYRTTGGSVAARAPTRMTITRDSDKLFALYQNGDLVFSLTDTNDIAALSTNFLYFFKDNGGSHSGEAAPGAVDFIHVYDNALGAAQVKALPMPTAVAEPASLGLMGAGLALVGWTRRRKS
ncbi:LamG-like jellyroll fold domain-containing protein [Massilia consociata]|uniref:LamG-like jellyroll fold domain-containing protein n=1 Tax=Massilia consociata TaxID=760117 RepID=A0ABV6FLE4_9BURK